MKISVVTISYNQGAFLKEAIESVLNQSYKDIEYIVIDAGSKDESREIINQYSAKLAHILFEPDKGPADGLNKGLNLCSGDIFCYLNADDKFYPGAFQFIVNFFDKNKNYDGVLGSALLINEKGEKQLRRRLSTKFTLKEVLYDSALALQQATFIRLSSIKDKIYFNTENKTCWDSELLVDLCLTGGSLKVTNKILGEFRIHSNSITGSNRLIQKYLEDKVRINQKIILAGFTIPWPYIKLLKKVAYMINPIRRVQEILYNRTK
jgi:glycosyltransferase involved in cell wall biosynthesis